MLCPLEHLKLKTKTNSLAFGRRLYTFEHQQQNYWLKLQLAQSDEIYQQGFLNELNFYRQVDPLAQCILPVTVIQIDEIGPEVLWPEGIVLPHADLYFEQQINDLSLIELKKYIEKALIALEKLHALGWIHGDLKTEHFVYYQQKVGLIDFEQSRKIEALCSESITATPHYMAPELFHGQPKSIQSDLYALGIILYEWLTQQRLTAQSYQEWAILHCQQLHIALDSDKQCFLPLLQGLLKKHKNQRFQDIKQALDLLNGMDLPI